MTFSWPSVVDPSVLGGGSAASRQEPPSTDGFFVSTGARLGRERKLLVVPPASRPDQFSSAFTAGPGSTRERGETPLPATQSSGSKAQGYLGNSPALNLIRKSSFRLNLQLLESEIKAPDRLGQGKPTALAHRYGVGGDRTSLRHLSPVVGYSRTASAKSAHGLCRGVISSVRCGKQTHISSVVSTPRGMAKTCEGPRQRGAERGNLISWSSAQPARFEPQQKCRSCDEIAPEPLRASGKSTGTERQRWEEYAANCARSRNVNGKQAHRPKACCGSYDL